MEINSHIDELMAKFINGVSEYIVSSHKDYNASEIEFIRKEILHVIDVGTKFKVRNYLDLPNKTNFNNQILKPGVET